MKEGNYLVVGTTGSGKTSRFVNGLAAKCAETGENLIAMCRVNDIPKELFSFLDEKGFKVRIINIGDSLPDMMAFEHHMAIFCDISCGLNARERDEGYNQKLFEKITHRKKYTTATHIVIDEMLHIGQLPDLYKEMRETTSHKSNTGRMFYLLTQSIAGLEKIYGKKIIKVMNEVNTIVCLRTYKWDMAEAGFWNDVFGSSVNSVQNIVLHNKGWIAEGLEEGKNVPKAWIPVQKITCNAALGQLLQKAKETYGSDFALEKDDLLVGTFQNATVVIKTDQTENVRITITGDAPLQLDGMLDIYHTK